MHFNTTVPRRFAFRGYAVQQGLSQVAGVCIGANQEFSVRPRSYVPAATLDDLKADDTNRKYFYDPAVGVVMFRFSNPFPRQETTTSLCPGDLDDDGNGICDSGPRIMMAASNDDGDCRVRAYEESSDYATEPVGSEGALTVPVFA